MKSFLRPLGLVCVLIAAAAPAAGQAKDQPGCAPGAAIPNVSMNCPDMYAWTVFSQVVAPLKGADAVTFESWSSDGDTFQCPPATKEVCDQNPGAAGCPIWPASATREKKPSVLTQRSTLDLPVQAVHPPSGLKGAAGGGGHSISNCWLANNTEIVYRNRATFDYIVQNGLWYQEGNAQAFLNNLDVNFPIDAIEVKTNWKVLGSGDDPSRYLTRTISGQLNGLIAMHISTKALPNWFWSTFEHVDNPGRCDFLGCSDSFGFAPAYIPPHTGPQCGQYDPGTPTAGWEKLGMAPVFRNYRLKGSMTDFTTPTGKPILLGNSVTEATFVQTASCMTCHSRATVSVTGVSPYPNVAGFTPDSQSYNGTPRPEWYYADLEPQTTWSLQTDFVWAVPFKAFSDQASAACCKSGFPGSTVCTSGN